MSALENRIPPPLVAFTFGLLMWLAARNMPGALDLAIVHCTLEVFQYFSIRS